MSQIAPRVRYAVARAGESWPEATLAGLARDPGGDLRLLRVPGLEARWLMPPADLGESGLALDDQCGLYLTDTAGDRIARIGLDCNTKSVLPGIQSANTPGLLSSPTGLCFGPHGWLFVANGDGRVLVFTAPEMALRGAFGGFQQPAALACHDDAVLVVDTGAKRLMRVDAFGNPDMAFDAVMVPPHAPADPRAVVVGADSTIYVGDAAGGGVATFDWSGAVAGPTLAAGTQPRALAVAGSLLFVGDSLSGKLLVYSIPGGALIGAVGGFQGPVTALAATDSLLYIKTGLDDQYRAASMASWFIPTGTLTFGPVDAGDESTWRRASVKCSVEDQTAVALDYYSDTVANPAIVAWRAAPCLDLLLNSSRYLWLRVTLSTRSPSATPTLLQLDAQTTGDSYLDYLPYVYTHDPDRSGLSKGVVDTADPAEFEPGDLAYLRSLYARTPLEGDFISRLLELVRSQLGDLELSIAEMAGIFDPATTPASFLRWLSSWMAFDIPPRLLDGAHPDEVREILLGLARLYRRRGTPRGVRDFVELYGRVRPQIFEEFNARPVWVLGDTILGFGTGLPDRDLEGILVGDSVVGETGPEDAATLGYAAFASTAHRFSVLVPPTELDDANRKLIQHVVETEKPAHTAFHICFMQPAMQVGFQARVGLDAIVAREPASVALDETATLGLDARLSGSPAGASGAVGRHGQVGIDTRLG